MDAMNKDEKMEKEVNHPSHYVKNGFEVIDIIKAFVPNWAGDNQAIKFAHGNAIKYVLRAGSKGGVKDLKKAIWYLEYMIRELEKE